MMVHFDSEWQRHAVLRALYIGLGTIAAEHAVALNVSVDPNAHEKRKVSRKELQLLSEFIRQIDPE